MKTAREGVIAVLSAWSRGISGCVVFMLSLSGPGIRVCFGRTDAAKLLDWDMAFRDSGYLFGSVCMAKELNDIMVLVLKRLSPWARVALGVAHFHCDTSNIQTSFLSSSSHQLMIESLHVSSLYSPSSLKKIHVLSKPRSSPFEIFTRGTKSDDADCTPCTTISQLGLLSPIGAGTTSPC
jgi:hypothetical protein